MKIDLDKSSSVPLYQQIVDQVRAQVLTGALAPGYRLPPERQLSNSLGVNRTTVMGAYRELKAEGLIGSHVGRGTVVLPAGHADEAPPEQIPEPTWNHFFSEYSNRFGSYGIGELLHLANRTDIISFGTGIAAPELGPVQALRGIERDLVDQHGYTTLMNSPVEGFTSLREALARYMEKRGCYCTADQVMLLSGSQQGIDLAARVLLDPGDVVVVEEPTFFPALQVFKSAGARVLSVPVDQDGMQTDVLEQLLERYRPKFLYTMPTFQNPTGTQMILERRKQIVQLAWKYKTLIIEDDAYGELRYDAAPLPTLKSMDSAGYVIYLNTFSKTIYPGLRIGWMVADKKVVQRFSVARQLVDLHTNCLSQRIIERFLRDGGLEEHLSRISSEYRARRDVMASALAEHGKGEFTFTLPNGGYYLWCRLPEGVSASKLVPKAAQAGVIFLPGGMFSPSGRMDDHIRLNFTYAPRAAIDQGIKLLCKTALSARRQSQAEAAPPFEINPIV